MIADIDQLLGAALRTITKVVDLASWKITSYVQLRATASHNFPVLTFLALVGVLNKIVFREYTNEL